MEFLIVKNEELLQECFKIRHEVFTLEQNVPKELDKDEFDVIDFSKSCHVFVHMNGTPIATGRLKHKSDDTVQFNRIAVRKEFRGRGIGEKLISYLENYAKQKGYKYVFINSQVQVVEFYKKNEYINLGEEPFLDAGILHVSMKKELI